MDHIIFSYPSNESLAQSISNEKNIPVGNVIFRQFPDGDSHVQIKSDVNDKDVILVCSLIDPNCKTVPILFFARTAQELGAKSVTLITAYLPYMRQDKRFQAGEAINSKLFGELVSNYFDRLITIDPHLHRHSSLSEIYTINTQVLHAANIIAQWINNNVKNPVLVGPDSESKQWVQAVAENANAPFIVLEKTRHGDRDVDVSIPHVNDYLNHTPVLLDDIISTAHTMIETVKHLNKANMKPTICIGVHAVFAGTAYQDLLKAKVEKIITCNTIPHESNGIDVTPLLSESL